jgi:hypothetical protein
MNALKASPLHSAPGSTLANLLPKATRRRVNANADICLSKVRREGR